MDFVFLLELSGEEFACQWHSEMDLDCVWARGLFLELFSHVLGVSFCLFEIDLSKFRLLSFHFELLLHLIVDLLLFILKISL